MLKKLLSYFIPIVVFQKQSAVSKNLEIAWNNGELVLDSKNTNYSYGSLQRVLRKGLREIGFEKIKSMQSILILGVAGGSVIKTLVNEIEFIGKITGVEIDPDIIKLANEYFGIDKFENLEIIIADASVFVQQAKEQYDLIVIDIFEDAEMPGFLFEKSFHTHVAQLLRHQGFILFNTMTLNAKAEIDEQYLEVFDGAHFEIKKLSKIEQHNELIIIEKTTKKRGS